MKLRKWLFAYFGRRGDRGHDALKVRVQTLFLSGNVELDVQELVQSCLLFIISKLENNAQATIIAIKYQTSKEVVHLDILVMSAPETNAMQ